MKWIDHTLHIELTAPLEFSFQECLVYLGRNDHEVLHKVKNGNLYKLIKINKELILLKISSEAQIIHIEFPDQKPTKPTREAIATYVWEWFDLDRNLEDFYELANRDVILKPLVERYYGLRIIGIPDLVEALTWAVIGQQINLTFAYTLKKRLVEEYGEGWTWNGETYWLYPTPEKIATISVDDLRPLQFSQRKAEYIIDIAAAMNDGKLIKANLLKMDLEQMQKALVAIRGIGAWTADYCIMKCLNNTSAFPIADVGLHNALKLQLGLERKPTVEEIKEMAKNWEGWEAYATFYLWRALL